MKMNRGEKIIAGTMLVSEIACICGTYWSAVLSRQISVTQAVAEAMIFSVASIIAGAAVLVLRK